MIFAIGSLLKNYFWKRIVFSSSWVGSLSLFKDRSRGWEHWDCCVHETKQLSSLDHFIVSSSSPATRCLHTWSVQTWQEDHYDYLMLKNRADMSQTHSKPPRQMYWSPHTKPTCHGAFCTLMMDTAAVYVYCSEARIAYIFFLLLKKVGCILYPRYQVKWPLLWK